MLKVALNAVAGGQSPEGAGLGDEEYRFLCGLIYEESRICLGPDKRVLVASRLARRLRALGLGNYKAYCALLRGAGGREELRFLIDRISTNHTHFFREMKHFEFMERVALPRWGKALGGGEKLRVWSAACATGEEVYSLGMCLGEHYRGKGDWGIAGSDISTRVLEVARAGVYEGERLAGVNQGLVRRYFQRGVGEWEGQYRVKEELRSRVRWHHLNLLNDGYPWDVGFHVVFCRNVMIYFDRKTQEELVGRLTEVLARGGYLMVGHSESLSGVRHGLKLVQPSVYVKE